MSGAEWLFLSHPLSGETPGYGGESGFSSVAVKSIAKGDSNNSSRWELSNHIGTHIDAPFHFDASGATVDSLPPSFWVFNRPFLVDRPAERGEILGVEAWLQTIPSDADLLLLRTGFEMRRTSRDYWEQNPGLAPELGTWLRANRPNLRAIGFDFLSVTSYQHRPLGRKAHYAFLGSEGPGRALLPIEDMALASLDKAPERVIISPIRVVGADGAPVTVLAENRGRE